MAFVQSFGAAKVVTGSAHLLSLDNGKKILIDCGMFQGENEEKNKQELEFSAHDIDYLVFTHAHLDHVGRSPILFKNGFRGEIIATKPTLDLARIILLDSAHIIKEDYRLNFKKAQRCGEENKVKLPMFIDLDVDSLLNLKKRYASYNNPIKLDKDLSITFHNAGHILGSAFLEINFFEDGIAKSIIFSGDLGNKNDIVLPSPQNATQADTLYIESTYGDRNHKNIQDSTDEFKNIVIKTLKNGGNVIIPSFAIERTQEILLTLKMMYLDGELPQCRVFLDSPMAIRATRIYNKYADELSEVCQNFFREDGSVFEFPYLEFIQTPQESKKINEIQDGAIIIAGSGMCNGGRILHHFKHHIWNKKNAVLFVGYQAKGTPGREIVDGAKSFKLYNEKIIIASSIHTINGFSAHADQTELIKWIENFQRLGDIYLIHGEEDKQIIFKEKILEKLDKKVHIVDCDEEIHI
jgi:metallo-beta-lactamase family protein